MGQPGPLNGTDWGAWRAVSAPVGTAGAAGRFGGARLRMYAGASSASAEGLGGRWLPTVMGARGAGPARPSAGAGKAAGADARLRALTLPLSRSLLALTLSRS